MTTLISVFNNAEVLDPIVEVF